MRKAGGYITVVDPGAPLSEQDTFTCIHCNGVVRVKPGLTTTDFAWCRGCMKPICERERCNVRCVPWERKMEQMELRGRLRRALDEASKK